MKSVVSFAAAGLLVVSLLSGCITSPVSISPSSVPVQQGQYTVVQEDVSGRAFGLYVFGWPISELRQMAAARDRATAVAGADALINITSDYSIINFMLFQLSWTTVRGDAVQLNE